jgi:hypothetical protein
LPLGFWAARDVDWTRSRSVTHDEAHLEQATSRNRCAGASRCSDRTDKLRAKSAAISPLAHHTGQHGFDFPGAMTDEFRDKCKTERALPDSTIPCASCPLATTYDKGAAVA